MQYSFSYYYYMMNRHKLKPLDIEGLWKHDLDIDGNGHLDDNEMITLVSLSCGKDPTYEYLLEIKECIIPGSAATANATREERGKEMINDGGGVGW